MSLITGASNNFSISGNQAQIKASTTGTIGVDNVTVDAVLQRLIAGSWTPINSWNNSSNSTYVQLNTTYTLPGGGYSYRMVTTHTATDAGTTDTTTRTSGTYIY